MTKPYGTVYHIFNKVTGRCYVGQTVQTLEQRWKEHLSYVSWSERPLYRAMRKHGVGAFVLTKLTEVQSQKDLDAAELYFGEHFHAMVPEGYCLKLGEGNGRHCEETKEKIREKRRQQNERNGTKSPRYGTGKRPMMTCRCGKSFLLSYSDRKFCSRKCYAFYDRDKMASRWSTVGVKCHGKKVIDLTTGKVYASARLACRELEMERGSFRKILSKGERFLYVEGGKEIL